MSRCSHAGIDEQKNIKTCLAERYKAIDHEKTIKNVDKRPFRNRGIYAY